MKTNQTAGVLISVLLPVYNGAEEISQTVEYILKQTFRDFELLLLDDGSTDETWQIINNLAATDSRIRIFRNEQNIGVVKSTIILTDAAMGEILIKEDCGDFSNPNRYKIQYDVLKANPEASACVSDYWLLETDGTAVGIRQMPETAEVLRETVKDSNITAHASFAMRKSAYEKVGGYDKSLPCSLDYDILLKLMNVGPVIPINRALVAVRFNPYGITFRNLRKQAACAELIKARHFGGEKPKFINYDPLPIEEAKAEYHKTMGKIHLAKGRARRARKHFKAAAGRTIDAQLLGLTSLSLVPGSIVRLLRRFRDTSSSEETETPFF